MSGGLYETVKVVLEQESDSVNDYLDGEEGAKNFLVGKVMQETGGAADPGDANRLIDEVLDAEEPDWPVTFEVWRRPVDRDTLMERLAGEVPQWCHDEIPDSPHDPTAFSFGFEVTVHLGGHVEIDIIEEDDDG